MTMTYILGLNDFRLNPICTCLSICLLFHLKNVDFALTQKVSFDSDYSAYAQSIIQAFAVSLYIL